MLTARQKQLLKIIIEEFIQTADAVGSLNISDKYHLEVSPATIRNEMARLAELGMLEKAHASAGRRPTTDALRWFLEQIQDDWVDIDVVMASEIRENLFQKRFNTDRLLAEAAQALYRLTNNTALAMLGGRRFTAGVSQFVGQPEYADLERLRKIITVLEDYSVWSELFDRTKPRGADVNVLLGEETGIDQFSNTAIVYAAIKVHGNENGYISVVGPNRMDYRKVIPAIKYIVRSVRDSVAGWA